MSKSVSDDDESERVELGSGWDGCYNIFGECDWIQTDEELVAELKKQNYCASWIRPGELKHILLKKFPEAFAED